MRQTLYKASTFTQLGKTVGSAIYKKTLMMEGDDNTSHTHNDDECTYRGGSLVTMDENDSIDGHGNKKDSKVASFMQVLSACHSPRDVSSRKN